MFIGPIAVRILPPDVVVIGWVNCKRNLRCAGGAAVFESDDAYIGIITEDTCDDIRAALFPLGGESAISSVVPRLVKLHIAISG